MKDLGNLTNDLGVTFKDNYFLTEALTHRSYLNENRSVKKSNERLEFLGDSVLSVLVTTELFSRYPDYPEGQLTSLRSALVRTKMLAGIAKSLNLGDYLLISKGEEKSGGRTNESLLADTFEAVIGGIYLDLGLATVKKILETHLFGQIEQLVANKAIFDYKSRLQETVQEKRKISPTYQVMAQKGPDHDKTFTIGVYLGSKLLAKGFGKSKQEAEQNAAQGALEKEIVRE